MNNKSVAILMGTFNGGKYISDQVNSFVRQSHKNWKLIISDDGSNDDTLRIIKQIQEVLGPEKIQIRNGPMRGFCQNFLSLACDQKINADYYAFSDQDDVWLPDKLKVAIDYLESIENKDKAHVYCGRVIYTKDDLKPYAMSPQFIFPPSFRNALIQSIAGGNTMVFNNSAKKLLEKVGVVDSPSHDWWIYQLVTGSGGYVHYDSNPYILYRQHRGNLVGENSSINAKLNRFLLIIQGRLKSWTDKNIECLNLAAPHLETHAKEILDLFCVMRKAKLKDRIRLMEICGLYRQTWRGTVSLTLALLLNKL